jgi:hypothetical protein
MASVQHVLIIYLLYQLIKETPYEDISRKVTWFYVGVFYAPLAFLWYLYIKYHAVHGIPDVELVNNWGGSFLDKAAVYRNDPMKFVLETLLIPVFSLTFFFLAEKLTKRSNLKSDELNDEDIFIFIIKPKNFNGLMKAAFNQVPISSIFLYAHNSVYCFRAGNESVQKLRKPLGWDLSRYIILNTGKKIKDYGVALSNLPGTKRRVLQTCLTIFTKPFEIDLVRLLKEKR